MNTATTPGPGEHLIGYAYPSSTVATRLKCSRTGCYYIATPALESPFSPFSSYEEALACVEKLGTVAQRWSMDHPLNARFLQSCVPQELLESESEQVERPRA